MMDHIENSSKNEYRKGLLIAVGCMVLWGVLPVYWKMLIPISSWVIIIYRILLVNLVAMIFAKVKYSWKEIFRPLRQDPKMILKFVAAGAVVTVNWSTYIWAVNAGHIIDASIGYYIEPLMICVFGIVLFKEKLTRYNTVAMILAAVAVIILLIYFRQIPGISLGIALTFAVYTAIKKTIDQPPLISLVYETMVFAPPALAVIIYLEVTGQGALAAADGGKFALLLLCGLMTVVPLSMFAYAAQRISMFALGLSEYISPTISMVLGILVYREALDPVQFIAVCIIWVGLVFFSYGEWKETR